MLFESAPSLTGLTSRTLAAAISAVISAPSRSVVAMSSATFPLFLLLSVAVLASRLLFSRFTAISVSMRRRLLRSASYSCFWVLLRILGTSSLPSLSSIARGITWQ